MFKSNKYNDAKKVAEMSLEDIQRIDPLLPKEISTDTMNKTIKILEEKNERLLNSVNRANRGITKDEMNLNNKKIKVLEAFKMLKSGEKSIKKIEGSLADNRAARYVYGEYDLKDIEPNPADVDRLLEQKAEERALALGEEMANMESMAELEGRLAGLKKGGKSHKRKKGSSKRSRRKRSSKRSKRKYAR